MGRKVALTPALADVGAGYGYPSFEPLLYDFDADTLLVVPTYAAMTFYYGISPKGTYGVSGSHFDGANYAVYDLSDNSSMAISGTRPNFIHQAVFSPDEQWLFLCGESSPYAVLYKLVAGTWTPQTITGTYAAYNTSGNGAVFNEGSTKLLLNRGSGGLHIVDLGTLASTQLSSNSLQTGAQFSVDGLSVIYGTQLQYHSVVLATGVSTPYSYPTSVGNNINWCMSADNRFMAVINTSSTYLFTLYSMSGLTPTRIPTDIDARSSLTAMSFSPDGKYLVVGASSPVSGRYTYVIDTATGGVLYDAQIPQNRLSTRVKMFSFANFTPMTISGTVLDADGNPAERNVTAFVRSTRRVAGRTKSDPITGAYTMKVYDGNVPYDMHFEIAPGENLNDLFFARVTAA